MYQVNQFAVFGFNSNSQNIVDSHIFVKINYSILTGALICLECDIYIINSNLQFIASGLQISAIILKSNENIQLNRVNISFRFNCNYSSGIVNLINSQLNFFNIQQCIITGFNADNVLNGYLISKILVNTQVNINQLRVCVNENMQSVGIAEQSFNIIGEVIITCQKLCVNDKIVTFGICYENIQFATVLNNFTQICADPFTFDSLNNICVCQYGYYLNGSICVNVINELSKIFLNVSALDVKLHTEIQHTDLELKNIFYNLEKEIQSNISNLSQFMFETYSDLKQDMSTTNLTLHKTLKDLNTNVNLKFQICSDQNIMIQSIINGFKTESSTNFSALNTKLGIVNTLITDNHLNITKNLNQTQTQISDLKTTMGTNFDQVDTALVQLDADVASTNTSVHTLNLNVNTKLVTFNTLINDNQLNIKNNFTQTQTYISDIKTQMITNFDQVDTALIDVKTDISSSNTNLNSKFVNLNTLINDNQLNIQNNFTQAQSQITNLKTDMTANFEQIDIALSELKTDISGINSSINTLSSNINVQLNSLKTHIDNNQIILQNNFIQTQTQVTDLKNVMGTKFNDVNAVMAALQTNIVSRATQSYLTDVYNSLTSQISALKTATNPCTAWPGSINEGGFCKCVYGQYPSYCRKVNKCCVNDGYDRYTCVGGGSFSGISNCGAQVYTNG
ncbi:BspA_family leucine-rich repeat surface protein [Hexamita inflata]|uniref:BspA family leucine-rich repeat surface protein n=1 Tax=Hexamita inflata TaxID=28002 RepID=A0AA86QCG4_9EUKA|nr:BspA family leucine-rich repeat surface protein [Hexamita inflata]